jgi:hypothetical protein
MRKMAKADGDPSKTGAFMPEPFTFHGDFAAASTRQDMSININCKQLKTIRVGIADPAEKVNPPSKKSVGKNVVNPRHAQHQKNQRSREDRSPELL